MPGRKANRLTSSSRATARRFDWVHRSKMSPIRLATRQLLFAGDGAVGLRPHSALEFITLVRFDTR
ncbi:MAG: hypothetical protein DI549_12975 [Ancylobacter novellus]|uniref:Uncharacterized protein n=1 Tax=Ancylobacter novellus TaxID=921 RepID=A0A2W5QYU7_ANCNO|nr:MAG: hypothetical protein DI549_12975 [Ancylobacter novellus]